ncbi:MAG: SCP2 sterol-binding domain-containing protein [Anaerolineae bacterium]|jgi:putative sterol carrier protein
MAELTARQIIEEMPDNFRPERAGRANAVVQFRLTGEGGGDWHVTIKDKTCTVVKGVTENPTATIQVDTKDYVALSTGKLGSMKAFATGKVKASGDLTLMRRMENWFYKR